MKKLTALLAALVLALVTLLGATVQTSVAKVVAPVAKRTFMTDVTHAGDDSGYTAPIHVRCNSGTHLYLQAGQSTILSSGSACTLSGVDVILVGDNQAVRCFNMIPPYESRYMMKGSWSLPSYGSYKCYMQRPI